ncbi:MAG: DUF4142 domain-containing protein [Chryseolinea sp.]
MSTLQHSILAASLMVCPTFVVVTSGQEVTTVAFANISSEVPVVRQTSENQLIDFLTTSANTTATNIADCNLAIKRGNKNEIKTFSIQIMQEQQAMMKRIKALALKNEIVIPFDSFVKRNNTLANLADHREFDKIFLQKIIADLEINVDKFRAASECDDRWVRLFIADALPVLEGQLVRARSLHDTLK